MAMGTERSKSLHNFTLPCDLKWGNQRFLRCMKVNSGGQTSSIRHAHGSSSGSSDHHQHHVSIPKHRSVMDRERERDRNSSSWFAEGSPWVDRVTPPSAATPGGVQRFGYEDDGGISATREKVMLDLQTAADKIKNAFFKDGGIKESDVSFSRRPPPPPPSASAPSAEVENRRPWNLRTRRAACRSPASWFTAAGSGGSSGNGAKALRVDAPSPNPRSSQIRYPSAAAAQKSSIHRSDVGEAATSGEKKERAKFSVALSKRDVEEDFFSIAGHRLPRRPKKRARTVQKQLDTLFPGLWLTEVTPDMYTVPEAAP